MKLARRLFVLALASAAVAPLAGCAKAADTSHLEQEANGLLRLFGHKLDRLEEHRLGLEARAKALAGLQQGGGGKVESDFRAASARLAELRQRVQKAPAELAALGKGSAGRVSVIAKTGELNRELKDGVNIVQTAFNTYEAHLTNLEMRRADTVATSEPGGNITPPPPNTPASMSPPTPSGDLPPSSSAQGGPAQRSPAGGN